MSIGGAGATTRRAAHANKDAEHKAICRSVAAGVTYVVAAGNSGRDFARTVPAAYPEVLTVTAMSDGDGLPGAKVNPTCVLRRGRTTATARTRTTPPAGGASPTRSRRPAPASSPPARAAAPRPTWARARPPRTSRAPSRCARRAGRAGPVRRARARRGDRSASAPTPLAAATTVTGFIGDLLRPFSSRGYGPLVNAAAY